MLHICNWRLRGILVDCRKDFSGWSDCSMSGPKFLLSQQQWSTMRVHFASALAILSFQGYLEACQRPCSFFFRLALFGLSWTMQLWPCCYLMVAKTLSTTWRAWSFGLYCNMCMCMHLMHLDVFVLRSCLQYSSIVFLWPSSPDAHFGVMETSGCKQWLERSC